MPSGSGPRSPTTSAAAFESFDLLFTPTSPSVAFGLGERAADPLAMYMSDYCTVPMSLAGIPAISIPAGLAEPDGGGPELPVGLQIAGPAFSESLILDAAHAIEGAIGFDAVAGQAGGDVIEGEGLTEEQCRIAAEAALDELPKEFADQLGEVAIVIVEDSHPEDLMGIYDPVGGIERVVIFRDANPSEEEVRKTVLHEIGHFFGMDEDELERGGVRMSAASDYEPVIGLEIHVQLLTETKMFCGCRLEFGAEPNTHTCPVCLGHPGALPVANEQAIAYALRIAAGARLRDRSALDLPPQELLLPRPAEGLPDQPVRHSARRGRAARRRPDPSRPPRGGRGQAQPRRRVGADPRLRRLAGRLQPRRHARWSRSSPSPTSTTRRRPASGWRCCGPRCASSASPT